MAVVSAVTSLAENAATGQDRWPGPLDQVLGHAWIILGVGLALALLLALYALFREVKSSSTADDPPPQAAPEMPRWVVNRAQVRQVAAELGRRRRLRSVGITAVAGLHGAGLREDTLAEMVWAEEDPGRVTAGVLCLVQVSAQPQQSQPGRQPQASVSPPAAGTTAVGRCSDPVRSSGSTSSSAMLSTQVQASTEKLPPAGPRTTVAVSSLTRSAGIGTPGAWKIHSIVLSKLTSLGTSP